jgi:ketosteroid isomerase-like protein
MKAWGDFFAKNGPTLTWAPTRAQVIGAGDVGVTTGSAVYQSKRPDGTVEERHSEYLTVWRKQKDGSWKVIFDTGSTVP